MLSQSIRAGSVSAIAISLALFGAIATRAQTFPQTPTSTPAIETSQASPPTQSPQQLQTPATPNRSETRNSFRFPAEQGPPEGTCTDLWAKNPNFNFYNSFLYITQYRCFPDYKLRT